MDDSLVVDGKETLIQRSIFICKYTKITNEKDVDLDMHLKICGEKIPNYDNCS